MNNQARSPVLATACLVTLTAGSAMALEVEQQRSAEPDGRDFSLTGELLNKEYDQGAIRNDNVTAHFGLTGRYYDVGIHIDDYMAVGDDSRQTFPVKTGETTEFKFGLDYLFEVENWFVILPHYQFIDYPNWPNVPLKDDQHWLGVDAWYELQSVSTSLKGLEIGASFDYDPFYNVDLDRYRGNGGLAGHLFKSSIGARYFYQHAPVDLTFWGLVNMGNSEYTKFLSGGTDAGFTTLDLGVKYTSPLFLNEFWTTVRLEGHFWLEHDDRERIKAANGSTSEIILAVGVEFRPE